MSRLGEGDGNGEVGCIWHTLSASSWAGFESSSEFSRFCTRKKGMEGAHAVDLPVAWGKVGIIYVYSIMVSELIKGEVGGNRTERLRRTYTYVSAPL
jgi:hypothetical protein